MAVNPVNNYTKLRLMGLQSGMDTDSIIKQMLQLHQMRIDTRFRARTKFEWKQEALTNVSNLLTDFRWKYLTVMGPDAMRLSSVYNSTVAVLSGKNKDSVSVETTINSPTGTMRIGEIASLAKATSVSTTGNASRSGEGFKLNDKLGEILLSNGEIKFDYNGNAKVNVNGANIVINRDDMQAMINDPSRPDVINIFDYMNIQITANGGTPISFASNLIPGTSYTRVEIDGVPKKIYLSDFENYIDTNILSGMTFDPSGDAEQVFDINYAQITLNINEINAIKDGTSSFDSVFDYVNSLISDYHDQHGVGSAMPVAEGDSTNDTVTQATFNGKKISVNKNDDTITSVFNRANAIPRFINFDENGKFNFRINGVLIDLNKDMTIDDMVKKVNNSGAGVKMSYDRLSDMFTVENDRTGATNLTVWGMEAFGISNGTYNNGDYARVVINGEMLIKDSNSFSYRGVNITLNTTTGPVAPGEETVVTLKRDATDAVAKIKGFIDEYNVLMKKLEDMLNEKKTGKETAYGPLTEEEKSVMTEKQIADWEAVAKKGLLRNEAGLQSMIFSLRNSLYESIKSVGLSPADIGIKTGSYYDGTGGQIMLDEAKLKEALEADPERVMNVFMGGSDATSSSERGLLWRIDDLMRGYTNGSQSVSLASLETSIRRENEQIEKLQKKMYDEEERLYQKFAAMETAMSKLQEQSDWFASMLGGNQQKQ